MAIKVVVENSILRGSGNDVFLQKVATVYIDGDDYRILAPPRATGDALEWMEHVSVRKPEGLGSEIEVTDAYGVLAVRAAKEELERLAAARAAGLSKNPVDNHGAVRVRPSAVPRPEAKRAAKPTAARQGWSRGGKIAALGLGIAVLALAAAWLVVPEFREFFHLDKPTSTPPASSTPAAASPKNESAASDSIAIQVRRAKPPVEFEFAASGSGKQRLSLSVLPGLVQFEPGPTAVKDEDLPAAVPVIGGTVTVLKFGRDKDGGYALIDTSGVPRGTRIRGEVIGYAELGNGEKAIGSRTNAGAPKDSRPVGAQSAPGDVGVIGEITQGPCSNLQIGGARNQATTKLPPAIASAQRCRLGEVRGRTVRDRRNYIHISGRSRFRRCRVVEATLRFVPRCTMGDKLRWCARLLDDHLDEVASEIGRLTLLPPE